MANHHRGTEQPLERDPASQEQNNDILSDYQHENMDDFENVEHENHTTLTDLTRELDHLQHRVETTKGTPMEALNCPQHDLHRLSLTLCQLAQLEPLDDVLQQ